MKKSPLIALVATAVVVDGVRQVVQPGDALPEDTSEHDQRELLASGAAKSPDDQAALNDQEKRDKKAADADFQREREAVQAAQKSIAKPPSKTGNAETKPTTQTNKR